MRVSAPHHLGQLAAEERGGVLVFVAVTLPVLLLFAAFVLDVGNWFTHKRDLQKQADAAALAGGGKYTFPCADDPIEEEALRYSGNAGATHNKEKPADPARTHVLINSVNFWHAGGTDYSDGGRPCSTKFVDVKITEADIALFFPKFVLDGVLPAIDAHARVEIRQLLSSANTLPIGVPEVGPKVARAYFVDETSGNCGTGSGCPVIAETMLTKGATVNGVTIWDNAAAPLRVPVNVSRIGLRVALGGQTSTTCGQQYVICYDRGSPLGLVRVRGWSASGSAELTNPPLARSVTLVPGAGCDDPYFSSDKVPCASVGVAATVDFGTGTSDPRPSTGAKVSAVIPGPSGTEKPLDYDPATNQWVSSAANYFSVAAGAGPLQVDLKWEETLGQVTVGGKLETCSTNTQNNKCKGTFSNVHRTFATTTDRSGPIKLAQVWEGGTAWANSFQLGTEPDLVVRLGIDGDFKLAEGINDPLVKIRVAGGSQSGSIDCDPDWANIQQELANGCRPLYERFTTGPCPPGNQNNQWPPTPPAWQCVTVQTGGAVGQVDQGMKERILGGSNTCPTTPGAPGRNNWDMFPDFPSDDPRVVSVFLIPFGSLNVSGNSTVPVTDFATFYVTGFSGSPCAGDDPAESGMIVGRYIKRVLVLNSGGGGAQLCDFNGLGSCVVVMTQ